MSKWANDAMMDAALDYVAGSTRLTVCSAQPANFAGIAAVKLAEVTLDAGDFTKADGDASGRKVTVASQADLDILTSGTGSHVCLDNGSVLRYVTTCTPQALTDTGTVTVPAWDIEVADPT